MKYSSFDPSVLEMLLQNPASRKERANIDWLQTIDLNIDSSTTVKPKHPEGAKIITYT